VTIAAVGHIAGAAKRAALLEAVVKAVEAAAVPIMEIYAGEIEVQLKADQTPLTAADLASHTVLSAALAQIEPALPIVSEEGGLPSHDERAAWPAYWLVDPLDGTKEFLARNGEFTVNVALIEHGVPTLGAVGVPAQGRVFIGDVAAGEAWRLEGARRDRLQARRYDGGPPAFVASRRHGGERLAGVIERLEQAYGSVELLNVGSALKFCLLAEGQGDVYPRLAPTSEWDTAAAQAVLEAAGGAVLQLTGAPLAYTKADILNPSFVAVADPTADWLRWFR